MNPLKALILGLVQGIAEFLPISSSGHLELGKALFGLEELPLLFDVILHGATLVVVVGIFKDRILAILKALWNYLFHRSTQPQKAKTKTQKKKDEAAAESLAYVVPILVATVVTAAIGFVIEAFLPWNGVKAVSIQFIITAAVLLATMWAKPGNRGPAQIGLGRALCVGFAQGMGVFSGISRSGMTIAASLFCGLSRATAGEFSFLLSIPAILGALVLTLKDLGEMAAMVSWGQLALAFFAALFSGWGALKVLLKVIKGGKLWVFAPYLLVAGLIGLILG
ncbi:MAG TPA: undecaprenyl-diphosphate phosphatase [Rectinemataceae bacterium]